MDARPIRMDVFRTKIPMRSFEHAAASRATAEAVLVRVEYSDGSAGWGETLPRDYVTGETVESVLADLTNVLWPAYCAAPEAREIVPASREGGGRCMNAAVCAMDLAALRRLCDGSGRLDARLLGGLTDRPAPARRISARVSGVLGSADPRKTARRLRLMRWFRLRDFKLKLGFSDEIDSANLSVVHGRLGRALASGKCTLRVDANGAWDAATTPERVAGLKRYGVCVVEQPVYCTAGELAEFAGRCELPLMADESLLTGSDADVLARRPDRVWWNIRLSKNGGLTGALGLARKAAAAGATFVVGCMVGESGILSAAQRRLLQWCAAPRFVEGNYGRFLLGGDVTRPSVRFGWGGKLGVLRGAGLGVRVDPGALRKYGRLAATLRA